MSSAYSWGVWGGFTFSMPAPADADPDAHADPDADADAHANADRRRHDRAGDDAVGADDAWHNTSVTVTFTATDDASGVAYTEYSLDGGAWTRGTSVTIAPPKRTAVADVHSVAYRSADKAGNVETAQLGAGEDRHEEAGDHEQHRQPTPDPLTVALAATDTGAGVAATYLSIDGGAFMSATSATITGSGRHTVRFYSTDKAGNVEGTSSTNFRIT